VLLTFSKDISSYQDVKTPWLASLLIITISLSSKTTRFIPLFSLKKPMKGVFRSLIGNLSFFSYASIIPFSHNSVGAPNNSNVG
jgi:hypothetical protein